MSALVKLLRLPKEKSQEQLLRIIILVAICSLAVSTRLFSVLRYESVIHEFDPYFNYRSTQYLVDNGFYNFHNWFDDGAWYPLGRIIGGTIYPGLMVTAAAMFKVLHFFHITISIRNVCVFTAPLFSAITALVAYEMGRDLKDEATGLLSAALLSIVPGFVSRSVAGSYDNEGVAIFAMLFTYTMWVKAIKHGTLFWGCVCALAYFYMVSAWGAYVFIANLIPLYVLVMLVAGRFSLRLYIAYCTFYLLGTLLAMQITFVGFQPVQSSEHMLAALTFVVVQAHMAIEYVRSHLSKASFDRFVTLGAIYGGAAVAVVLTAASLTGYISPFTGRFWALLDPTYAGSFVPIIASVSEHQPTTWASYFFDLHMLLFFIPVGMYMCLRLATDVSIFIVMYAIVSVYFSGVMVRLMLVLAPIACVISALGLSSVLSGFMRNIRRGASASRRPAKKGDDSGPEYTTELSMLIVFFLSLLMVAYVFHCVWVTSEAYSSPSIVLAATGHDGNRIIFDDFREAYWWLRYNTPEGAKVMSWWDYGYQLAAMANRTILVDNNTWNNTHIATVGRAMAADEERSYQIMRRLDVDYVLVIFGGLTGYASDDINKFLWMVRIANSTYTDIVERDYFSEKNEYKIDADASETMLDSLMYKMCYFRFGEMYTDQNRGPGYDRVRGAEIGRKTFGLKYIEEAYTSEHWLVRIYKVRKPTNHGGADARA
eukprot:c26662_g1_i1.p2 GENE.c26662_g1_i1~~c26662_g1_i1.p2  ORF type:complete len:721 (+),score=171.93 c26662_g1_i1:34-2163(+)